MNKSLNKLTDILGEDIINKNRDNAKKFSKEYKEAAKELKGKILHGSSWLYEKEAIAEVVMPRDPLIDSRILIVPPEEGETQKYDLLQTIGDSFITTVDFVSLPENSHRKISEVYVKDFLGQLPWYYVAGGHIEFKDKNSIKIYGKSGDFGASLAGYDSNIIAGYILDKSNLFKNIEVKPNSGLKDNPDEFFDFWLDLFDKTAGHGGENEFLEEAYKVHREKSSAPLNIKYLTELYLRATKSNPTSPQEMVRSLTNSMFEVQSNVFKDYAKKIEGGRK